MRKIHVFLIYCMLLFSLCAGAFAQPQKEEAAHRVMTYGASESGRPLECHIIGDESAAQSLLIVFGLHGFEDAFDHDGEVLKMIAENVIDYYAAAPEKLNDFCLYIVPSANPDGLYDGRSQDGFGRCNANGLDINRDFPIGWKIRTTARNKTGKTPFSTAEARARRDLVAQIHPTYGIDVHGWIEASYGTGKLAEMLAIPFNCPITVPRSGGMLCSWLDSVTRESAMLELPPKPNTDAYVQENSAKLIAGLDLWIELCRAEMD